MYLIIILTIEINNNNNNNNNKNDIVCLILSLFFSQSQRCADRHEEKKSCKSLLSLLKAGNPISVYVSVYLCIFF
jgi:hypothetical protein